MMCLFAVRRSINPAQKRSYGQHCSWRAGALEAGRRYCFCLCMLEVAQTKKAFRLSCTSTTISWVLITCLMLWKAQITGGHCPEVLTVKMTETTLALCEHPSQNKLQSALCCQRRTSGAGITCLEMKVGVESSTSLRFCSHEIDQ